jgi:hypothetical protein
VAKSDSGETEMSHQRNSDAKPVNTNNMELKRIKNDIEIKDLLVF